MVDSTPPHIRPRKRTTSTSAATQKDTSISACSHALVAEETRQRIETWAGLHSTTTGEGENKVITSPDICLEKNEISSKKNEKPLRQKGILKTKSSKYSGDASGTSEDRIELKSKSELPPVAVRDFVVERPRGKRKPAGKQLALKSANEASPRSAYSIEGYTPTTPPPNVALKNEDHSSCGAQKHGSVEGKVRFQDDAIAGSGTTSRNSATAGVADGEPLVLTSIADLLEMGGTLPKQDGKEIPQVIEAGLEFSCMDPDEYDALQQEAQEEQYGVFMGTSHLQEEEDDDDDVWDLLGDPADNDGHSDEEERPSSEPRAFLKLWTAISQWVTPEAVLYVRRLHSNKDVKGQSFDPNWIPQIDRSDVGASRCAGLMAILQMHTANCLVRDCNRSLDELRSAERLLASLVRCFDFDRPMPKLDTAHARALTCVLLVTVLGDTRDSGCLPESCKVVGMNQDEYRYLSRSAILNFSTPDE